MATQVKLSSSNAYNLTVLAASCNVNDILKAISPRWKMQILCKISSGTSQFSRLKDLFPTLSDQILGKRLAELVTEELVIKKQVPGTVPLQTSYIATPKGMALMEIMDQLHEWGEKEW
ncbi:winged helix-turn-helix transcriptional regulator [Chitinophaga pinensis]|uniref:Transcriptional regulator, HxlR family n=1 Tax=Chitinophaga pinensis (strain ATCC 43595 / DSM 2588 / LMG 13176 / NBRC 15968 / NCIMB 11800 / UQM 2034) TaxID=485918 RepID=A0A979GVD4_CHIPD|nr:helix-turn-helix domain-containing protein [Chitinophaga pinensis]ACU60996.1 transcriptional regulator, HxlR family [Chitinophaga pinensis DSM 2588]